MDEELYTLDTYVAIICLLDKLNVSRCSHIKIVFVHQLYSLVKNRTLINEELARLKEGNIIRMFSSRLSSDCFGIMLIKDYMAMLYDCGTGSGSGTALGSEQCPDRDIVVVDSRGNQFASSAHMKFACWVGVKDRGKCSLSVLKSTLLGYDVSNVNNDSSHSSNDNVTPETVPLAVSEVHALIRLGYLFPRKDVASMATLNMSRSAVTAQSAAAAPSGNDGSMGVDELYWVSHPQLSRHCQNILDGRSVIIKLISKAKFHELSATKLMKTLTDMQRENESSALSSTGSSHSHSRSRSGSGRKRGFAESIAEDIDSIIGHGQQQNPTTTSSGSSSTASVQSFAILPYNYRFHLYDLLGMKLVEKVNRSAVSSHRPGHYSTGIENAAGGEDILRVVPSTGSSSSK